MSDLILFIFASWVAGMSLHCAAMDNLTLCDAIIMLFLGPFAVLFIGITTFMIIWKFFYILAGAIALSVIATSLNWLVNKIPHLDVRKFCLVLWRKP